jgi:hypothetical protein
MELNPEDKADLLSQKRTLYQVCTIPSATSLEL